MRTRVLLLFGLALLALGAGLAYLRFSAEPPREWLRLSGNIEVTDVELSFRIPGWVERRPVSEGETLAAGALVATLESSELAEEVALREAEVRAVAAELAALEAGSRPQEIAAAEAAVRRAAAEVERTRLEFERQRSLHAQNLTSEQLFTAARAAVEVARAQLEEAKEQLSLVKAGPRQEEIEGARARLDQARHSLALARTRLAYASLQSPLGGLVLSENVEPGEYVVPGVPVVTVGDLENAWLRAYVNETDLGRVKPGHAVCIGTDTYPGKVYEGRLAFIASEAEFTPKNVQTAEERVKLVYRVKIDVANPKLELKPGMPADAAIWLGEGRAPCLP